MNRLHSRTGGPRRLLAIAAIFLASLCCLVFSGATVAHQAAPAAATGDELLPKVIWHAPREVPPDIWKCGPGGCEAAPAPPFRFLREDTSGTSPKVLLHDARNRTWDAKFGPEVVPECFASRFVMALGYFAEIDYFVGPGKIDGLGKLGRARRSLTKDGAFRRARFQLRDNPELVFLKDRRWAWTDNPFGGTHELAGLKILVMLLSDWDAADARDGDDSNNGVFRWTGGGTPQLLYAVTDWGASLGHWGGALWATQSDCSGYTRDTSRFITRIHGSSIEWGFSGKHAADLKNGVSLDDVRWLLLYLRRITPANIEMGLQASGATGRQATCWSHAVQNRIRQLEEIAR